MDQKYGTKIHLAQSLYDDLSPPFNGTLPIRGFVSLKTCQFVLKRSNSFSTFASPFAFCFQSNSGWLMLMTLFAHWSFVCCFVSLSDSSDNSIIAFWHCVAENGNKFPLLLIRFVAIPQNSSFETKLVQTILICQTLDNHPNSFHTAELTAPSYFTQMVKLLSSNASSMPTFTIVVFHYSNTLRVSVAHPLFQHLSYFSTSSHCTTTNGAHELRQHKFESHE